MANAGRRAADWEIAAAVKARGGFEYVGTRLIYQPMEFSRMLAKIAYGFAILQFGLDSITEAFVLPAILGTTDGIQQWVGCDDGSPKLPDTGLHAIQVATRGDEIHVWMRLCAQFGAPEYHVIVGRLRTGPWSPREPRN